VAGEDILAIVEESKTFGKVLGAMNATTLALIQKKHNLASFDDFRPISLCNSIYKIIFEVIAQRLKVILSDAISMGNNLGS
jgi:hypothetical protein